jgi:hypothetical protein
MIKEFRMDSFTKLIERLKEMYSGYETKMEVDNGINYFVIINPFWNENIRISYEDGIIFFFSFQHAHFDYCDDIDDNIDSLIEYINFYLEGEQVAIEFLQGKTNIFGGDRCQNDIDMSSGESLLKSFTGDNTPLYESLYKQLKGLNCHCSIRGWNSVNNKDIDFIL